MQTPYLNTTQSTEKISIYANENNKTLPLYTFTHKSNIATAFQNYCNTDAKVHNFQRNDKRCKATSKNSTFRINKRVFFETFACFDFVDVAIARNS